MSMIEPMADPASEQEMRERVRRINAKLFGQRPNLIVLPKPKLKPAPRRSMASVMALARQIDKEEEVAPQRSPYITEIKMAVCGHFGITHAELISHRRESMLVTARHVVCLVAKKLSSASYPMIASRLGGRDHTTVMAALRRVNRLAPDIVVDGSIPLPDCVANIARQLVLATEADYHRRRVFSSVTLTQEQLTRLSDLTGQARRRAIAAIRWGRWKARNSE